MIAYSKGRHIHADGLIIACRPIHLLHLEYCSCTCLFHHIIHLERWFAYLVNLQTVADDHKCEKGIRSDCATSLRASDCILDIITDFSYQCLETSVHITGAISLPHMGHLATVNYTAMYCQMTINWRVSLYNIQPPLEDRFSSAPRIAYMNG